MQLLATVDLNLMCRLSVPWILPANGLNVPSRLPALSIFMPSGAPAPDQRTRPAGAPPATGQWKCSVVFLIFHSPSTRT